MSDNTEVLKAINDLAKTVETYHGDFREFRGTYTEKVSVLEEEAKSEKFWRKVQMICVVPVMGGLHQMAQYFHWISK